MLIYIFTEKYFKILWIADMENSKCFRKYIIKEFQEKEKKKDRNQKRKFKKIIPNPESFINYSKNFRFTLHERLRISQKAKNISIPTSIISKYQTIRDKEMLKISSEEKTRACKNDQESEQNPIFLGQSAIKKKVQKHPYNFEGHKIVFYNSIPSQTNNHFERQM